MEQLVTHSQEYCATVFRSLENEVESWKSALLGATVYTHRRNTPLLHWSLTSIVEEDEVDQQHTNLQSEGDLLTA